jgi:hypothetical protein
MARILELKNTAEKKVLATLELSREEYRYLGGNIDKIVIFSGENLENDSRLVQRGKKESTKYFLLPRKLRKGIEPCKDVRCDRIELKDKDVFVFEICKKK